MISGPLIKGIILGLTLAVLIGPVFFVLLQTSIQRGFWAAFLLAFGIALSDTCYILLTNIFVSFFKHNETISFFLGVFGGIILIAIGILTGLKKPDMEDVSDTKLLTHYQKAKFFLKGFVLNFAHPGVFIFWLGVITLISARWQYDYDEKVILYSGTIATVFITDLLKSFLASRIKHLLSYKFLLWMNRVMGMVLIIFGIHLFVTTLI